MARIAVIGTGSVGAALAYTALQQAVAREIVLFDANAEKLHGEVLDLRHATAFSPRVELLEGRSVADCAGARVVAITAGVKQKPGQSRLDLASANAAMFHELIPQVVAAAPEATLLIISNPVDVLTDLAQRISGLPPERVIGSGTVLDTARFRHLLSQHFGVAPQNVHAYIVGEHGDSEVALWSSAQVGNVPLDRLELAGRTRLGQIDKQRMHDQVRGAAGEIIAAKGATNWAIGAASQKILRALLRDEDAILTVSRRLEGYHGVGDVSLSVPWVVNASGATTPLLLPFDTDELAAFKRSADVIRENVASLR